MQEIWLPIVRNPEFGFVSNLGRIKSSKGKLRTTFASRNGYDRVGFKGGSITLAVHALVAETFIPKPDQAQEVNHIDGNKLNNVVSNLEWVTKQENTRHAYDHGIRQNNHRKPKIPKEHRDIILNRIASGDTQRSIAKEYGVSPSSLCVYIKGRKTPPNYFSWRA